MLNVDAKRVAVFEGSDRPFRFGGEIAGENADLWEFCGVHPGGKCIVVQSPRSGTMQFPLSRCEGTLGKPDFAFKSFRFAEDIVKRSRKENGKE